MIAPIVLAAGESTRMGRPKALLLDREGRTFLARIVRTLADAGFGRVTVATGALHASLVAAIAADRPRTSVQFAQNPDPARGQLSSLWAAMDMAVGPGVQAILVTLVDVPFVSAATIRRVVDTYAGRRGLIVRPAIGARHGHPVLFDRSIFHDLRTAPLDQGAKAVLMRYRSGVVDVPIDDPLALIDIDTPVDYERALQRSVW